jgi:hypothetical protein
MAPALFSGSARAVTTEPIVSTHGALGNSYYGWAVGTAGDLNGDGYADVAVSAISEGGASGKVYVYFGSNKPDAVADLVMTGLTSVDQLGYSLAAAGDVNGDGFADLIVGAHGNSDGGPQTGRAYVYFGGTNMDNVPDWILTGASFAERFGNTVGSAGDVNGDGYADVIVGAMFNGALGSNTGRAYVFYGGPSPNAVADLTFTGEAAGNFFGCSVGTAGDVSGDGYDDVIVGAYLNEAGGTVVPQFHGTSRAISSRLQT